MTSMRHVSEHAEARARDTPDVSFVIASLARGNWIEAIESALNQSHPSFEVILVLDTPNYDAHALQELQLRHSRLIVLFNDKNRGLPASLNRGLMVARGRIIVRQDDDTVSTPDRLIKLTRFMDETGIDLAGSFNLLRFDHSPKTVLESRPTSDAAIKAALETRNCLSHPTIAIRADALRRIGGYNETFRYAQDYDLYLRAKRNDLKFGCLPEPLVTEHLGGSSITIAKRKKQMVYSLSAKFVHLAEQDRLDQLLPTLFRFLPRFLMPNVVRALWRRRLTESNPR